MDCLKRKVFQSARGIGLKTINGQHLNLLSNGIDYADHNFSREITEGQ